MHQQNRTEAAINEVFLFLTNPVKINRATLRYQ